MDRLEKPDRHFPVIDDDPWGFGDSSETAALPNSSYDSRAAYLKWRDEISPSACESASDPSPMPTLVSRIHAVVQSHLSFDRRIVAGLAVFGAVCASLIGLSQYAFAPSIITVQGTTYDAARDQDASAVDTALDPAGNGSANLVTAAVTSNTTTTLDSSRPTTDERVAVPSRALQLIPFISPTTVQASGPALTGDADLTVTKETSDTLVAAQADTNPEIDTSIVYSPKDTDITPPVVIRSPGIATGRADRDETVMLIDVLVNETGDVESAKWQRRPTTLSRAMQTNMALSVVRTWRFSPARRDGQPVKFRTTVQFAESIYIGRHE